MKTFDFTPLTLDSRADFLPYKDSCCFGDTTFRSLYAWQPIFEYRYVVGEGYLLLSEQTTPGEQAYVLLRKPETDISGVLIELMGSSNGSLKFEIVSEADLPAFEAAADILGLKYQAYSEERYSDYIYRKEDYCSLSGNRQKSLRGDINALLKQLPELRMELFRPEHAAECLELFDRWCSGRSCSDCFYGCERKVFERFLQVYQEPECFGALAFSGDQPLSFLMGEILPGGVWDIHFQKNAVRQRGLTYWLSREFAMQNSACAWIDLEEDMGLPGIRMDKSRLHPDKMKKKYTVDLQL